MILLLTTKQGNIYFRGFLQTFYKYIFTLLILLCLSIIYIIEKVENF